MRAWGEREAEDRSLRLSRKEASPQVPSRGGLGKHRGRGTLQNSGVGKGQKVVQSTLCASFPAEVGGWWLPSPASRDLLAQVSLQFSVAFPNLEGELHRQSPARPSPRRPDWGEGRTRGRDSPLCESSWSGTRWAIDSQGPRGTLSGGGGDKGTREEREGAVPGHPAAPAC